MSKMGIATHSCQNPSYLPGPAASSGSNGKNWVKCLLLGFPWAEKKALLMINPDASHLEVEGQKEQETDGCASNILPTLLLCYMNHTKSYFLQNLQAVKILQSFPFFLLIFYSLSLFLQKKNTF